MDGTPAGAFRRGSEPSASYVRNFYGRTDPGRRGLGRWLVPLRTSSVGVMSQPFPVRIKHKSIYLHRREASASVPYRRREEVGGHPGKPRRHHCTDGTRPTCSANTTAATRPRAEGLGRGLAVPPSPGRPILKPFCVVKERGQQLGTTLIRRCRSGESACVVGYFTWRTGIIIYSVLIQNIGCILPP